MVKILIVEDEIYSRKSMIKQVREFDQENQFQIYEVSNGKQGYELFQREKPDLILSDIRMPVMDGLEMLSAILGDQPDAKVIMMSAHADFSYACDALNLGAEGYLLKPINDEELYNFLRRFIQQNCEKKENDYIFESDIVTKHIYKKIMTDDDGENYIIDSIFQKMFKKYVIINIYFSDGRYPEKKDFLQEIKKVQGRDMWTGFRMINISKKSWVMVVNATNSLDSLLQRMIGYLEDCKYQYYIGISNEHQSIKTVKIAYQQSLTAVKYKILHTTRVLYYKEISNVQKRNDYPKEHEIEKIRICMEQGNATLAMQMLHELLERIFKQADLEIGNLEILLMRISTMFNVIIEKQVVDSEEKRLSSMEFPIIEYDDQNKLEKTLLDKIIIICKLIKGKKTPNAERIVDAVLDYVNKNYNKEISLKDLADNVFFVNHTYLSYLFKEKTGNSYSNYLRKVRIEKAKEYLLEGSLTITEVATYSGYNDSSQFIRIFKQEVGMTPKKFQIVFSKR